MKWLYNWIDKRGRIPKWVRWIYPRAHFCCELDYLLVLTDAENDEIASFCDCVDHKNKRLHRDPT